MATEILLSITFSLFIVSVMFNYFILKYAHNIRKDYNNLVDEHNTLKESYEDLYERHIALLEEDEGFEIRDIIEEFNQSMYKRKEQAERKMAEMRDDRDKKIGDRVKIWDYSFAVLDNEEKAFDIFYKGSEESKQKLKDFIETEAIVIETDCTKEVAIKIMNQEIKKICDLCIEFPDKTRIYTPSVAVRRTDKFDK